VNLLYKKGYCTNAAQSAYGCIRPHLDCHEGQRKLYVENLQLEVTDLFLEQGFYHHQYFHHHLFCSAAVDKCLFCRFCAFVRNQNLQPKLFRVAKLHSISRCILSIWPRKLMFQKVLTDACLVCEPKPFCSLKISHKITRC